MYPLETSLYCADGPISSTELSVYFSILRSLALWFANTAFTLKSTSFYFSFPFFLLKNLITFSAPFVTLLFNVQCLLATHRNDFTIANLLKKGKKKTHFQFSQTNKKSIAEFKFGGNYAEPRLYRDSFCPTRVWIQTFDSQPTLVSILIIPLT